MFRGKLCIGNILELLHFLQLLAPAVSTAKTNHGKVSSAINRYDNRIAAYCLLRVVYNHPGFLVLGASDSEFPYR